MASAFKSSLPLEVWAGVECTVNRVGEEYFDQLERNGHATRLDDLDLFAELGIQAIRYPVLWERIAPNGLENADWSWADERLERLWKLGIRPIVGLVHHGSGPRDTSLIDPEFPEKLAVFARAVAERYPWVTHYTPVNEPLTTARFSGMYGHWYPHGRDDLTFARALLGECRAIALSMQAIREVNPNAQLVQTEDLGKTYSTPKLAYQAEFENERRWLSLDLLCGRITPNHPMWGYLRYCGISEAELEVFLQNTCPPDIIGINHYLTSERFLDEHLENYPAWTHGGNGRDNYADVEAVRVCSEGLAGPRTLLQETWERYQLPLAVTEVHLSCTREEQLRWLQEVWNAAQELKDQGADVRAVTVWSLLGSYDWNSLLTRCVGYYEPGVFDLRSRSPRKTAIAKMVQDLAAGRKPNHPILETPGWWHRPARLVYPAVSCGNSRGAEGQRSRGGNGSRPLAIIGATGTLGRAFARLCEVRGISYRLLTRQDMDIANPASIEQVLTELQPWAVVNAAGYVRVDDAEREPHICLKINAEGPAILAAACAQHHIALLTFSSDLVFDGTVSNPYVETDTVAPLNVYGCSKVLAEKLVLQAYPASLVIRTSAFFGPWDEYNFVTIALRQLAAGNTFVAAEDAIVSPTYVPDLVHTSLDLLIDGENGLWHLANKGAVAWADLARLAAKKAGVSVNSLISVPSQELGFIAPRPAYSVLGSSRAELMPHLDSAISRYLEARS
ncbi:dTDP-4-dehydrorhamnose reductase [Tolypothrix tenuis PCC 7101]|uniref:dTDP-4-dehydrorhamnose reductase n=1 Tax=Tolypothrix tenuis PCC 7101 TaxID=231146 RepID=A0A1Z4N0K4_9CYAN|nr:sugar nucleotide-binding protein [Aulosira sp. FACHB-113]BAY99255.1 dTDP-4-dehydrorhamnose reductase [Tolypothrix tenuis PCC 7101]BAZ76822.1 dTDP-4-dehydrorhamnose reductase [Aulosira laxa NIES-50]